MLSEGVDECEERAKVLLEFAFRCAHQKVPGDDRTTRTKLRESAQATRAFSARRPLRRQVFAHNLFESDSNLNF